MNENILLTAIFIILPVFAISIAILILLDKITENVANESAKKEREKNNDQ
jgi:hypothetical protein